MADYGVITIPQYTGIVPTEEVDDPETMTRTHYQIVILRDDQIDRIAEAVVRKLKESA